MWGQPLSGPVAGIVGAGMLIAWVLVRVRYARRYDLRRCARARGFCFSADGDPALARSLSSLILFAGSRGERVRNLLSGVYRERQWWICDYICRSRSGAVLRRHRQTVVMMSLGVAVPDFYLSARRFAGGKGAASGAVVMNICARPAFSRRYVLRGVDKESVSRLFRGEVTRFFEQRNRVIHVAARAGRLAMWYPDRLVHGQEMRAFWDMAEEFVQCLVKAAESAQADA